MDHFKYFIYKPSDRNGDHMMLISFRLYHLHVLKRTLVCHILDIPNIPTCQYALDNIPS